MPHRTLVERIRAEFLETPGLHAARQPAAQRFWGIDRAACRQLFDSLTEIGFLCVKPNGIVQMDGSRKALTICARDP